MCFLLWLMHLGHLLSVIETLVISAASDWMVTACRLPRVVNERLAEKVMPFAIASI